MAVTVKLPTILRKHAGNEAKVSAEGATLIEVLKDLESRYPGITKNVIAEDGGLHRFINVYLNDEDVRYLGSLETPVADGDTVSILPAVAGGQRLDRRAGTSRSTSAASTLGAGAAAAGSSIETVSPPPGVSDKPTWPCCASAHARVSASPRPAPPVSRARDGSARKKRSKARPWR